MFSHLISEAITFSGGSQPRKSREFQGLGGMTSTPWNGNSKEVGGLSKSALHRGGYGYFQVLHIELSQPRLELGFPGLRSLIHHAFTPDQRELKGMVAVFLFHQVIILITFLLYRFQDLMNNAPLPEYTRRDGSRNLVSRYTTVIYFYLKGCAALSLKRLFFLF